MEKLNLKWWGEGTVPGEKEANEIYSRLNKLKKDSIEQSKAELISNIMEFVNKPFGEQNFRDFCDELNKPYKPIAKMVIEEMEKQKMSLSPFSFLYVYAEDGKNAQMPSDQIQPAHNSISDVEDAKAATTTSEQIAANSNSMDGISRSHYLKMVEAKARLISKSFDQLNELKQKVEDLEEYIDRMAFELKEITNLKIKDEE